MNKALFALVVLLSGCAAQQTEVDPYQLLQHYDPDYTTVAIETAKNSAMNAPSRLALSPGRYCMSFIEFPVENEPLSGRIELTTQEDGRYSMATRYAFRDLVRGHTEVGTLSFQGAALIFSSVSGTQRISPITSAGPNEIRLWGHLPLTRDACTATPLQGAALEQAFTAAENEQNADYPWESATANPAAAEQTDSGQ